MANAAAPTGNQRTDQRPGPRGGVQKADDARTTVVKVERRAGKTARGMPKIMALRSIK